VGRVLLLAVGTACHRGGAVAEDPCKIATIRAGRVRAAMLCLGVGKRAESTGGKRVGTPVVGVAKLPAFGAL